jgi:hypothetical protein
MGNDDWLRLTNIDGSDYHGGIAAGKIWVGGNLDVGNQGLISDVKITKGWSNYPASKTGAAEISNDTGRFKQLMIVGNRSAGGPRTVGLSDRVNINGELCLNDVCKRTW